MTEFVETPLGILPRSWQIKPLGETTIKIQDGTHFSPQTDEGPCLYLTSKNIKFGKFDIKDCGWISQQEHDSIYARCDVKYGDVLLTKDGANTGNACLNNLTEPFSLLSSVAFLRTDGVTNHSGFILQYLLSPTGQRRLKDLMSGNAIPRLTLQKIKAFKTPVPTADEQRRIATILTTLDEVIEATEKLVEKHQQIKAGLMHDLFTRGLWTRPELARGDHKGTPAEATAQEGHLRPTPEEAPGLYQESPLGLIPKEWKVKNCSQICEKITVGIVIRPTQYYVPESGVPAFRSANIKETGIDMNDLVFISDFSNSLLAKSQVKAGDVLSVRTGYPGTSAVVPEELEGCNCIDILISRPTSEIASQFLCDWINSSFGRGQVLRKQGGLAQQHFNVGDLRNLQVVIPSDTEQAEIGLRLASATENIATENTYLAKLRQQKQGLMHDLLTGRVRVAGGNEQNIIKRS